MSGHFTDLRLNQRGGDGGEESFWPSFTDIMTVIVMIFLIAMLVLLLNNMELVKRLQATLAAERAASEQVASTSSQNRDLQNQLLSTQAQLDMLRMQLMSTGEERDKLSEQLSQSRDALEQSQAAAQQSASELEQERSARSALQTQLAQAAAQLAALGKERDQQQERMRTLEQDRQQAATRLASLQGDFATLKVKYDKLVRPARSAVGKYVVNVRIMRQDGTIVRAVQSPEQKQFAQVSETEMYAMLDKLHAAHPADMYVRIIFPDEPGLSYSEAWTMTETLLKKYDYYYLDSADGK
ncbi:MAG: hypothetical protein COS82_09180 [Zetaproteobacteria bacterium CG06_land_8_20_14_3_00_59_53]|nr:MAG: hypothetical protein AUK36_11495 [Zetaproteobacteria bacterium CG2_30_59_37]PIO89983.1 MAG: hypothetical protein COX56_05100 [Zetaproteobacteria bacterium CG23_combo_of_CG06-09_8_20_14_all_59_86]PIQ64090.1 MAG: hypothetical protein COV97_11225 [Zetaproteobacteria bacterium CG11_big_fil_rev_8_21_14_0_20_59_439]PIU69914.1 MAG: hypothetical protein COS82_09180 [Zetaproteobacteria bacterium CG06_land_8_20_14_3_00_59_53]PIU97588.1 MAG: hypothetical protein COS62_03095 [Zetaproteobacteria bac